MDFCIFSFPLEDNTLAAITEAIKVAVKEEADDYYVIVLSGENPGISLQLFL